MSIGLNLRQRSGTVHIKLTGRPITGKYAYTFASISFVTAGRC
jgi:hypothetical protein